MSERDFPIAPIDPFDTFAIFVLSWVVDPAKRDTAEGVEQAYKIANLMTAEREKYGLVTADKKQEVSK